MGKILCIGISGQITWQPSLLPRWFIGRTIDSYCSSPIQFSNFVKAYSRTAENRKHFVRPWNMFWLFTEIYWSLDEVILEQYWRVLYSVFKVVYNNYYFSDFLQYVFTLTAGKMATENNSSEIRNPKTSRASQLNLELRY
jgi:hypothetical protein